MNLEDYVQTAVQSIQNGINAQIDAINALHADFALPDIDPNFVFFGGDDTQAGIKYPYVEVAIPDEDLTNPSVGYGGWDATIMLQARAWVEQTKTIRGYPAMTRASYRMGAALRSTLLAPGAVGQLVPQHVACRYRTTLAQGSSNPRELVTASLVIVTFDDDVAIP